MILVAGVDVPLLAATAELPPVGTPLAAFIAALEGATVDSCGGFPIGQCTALACAWARNLGLGTPCGSCGAPDHCDGVCWVGPGFPGWTWIPNTAPAVPRPGDIVAYHANCSADGIGPSGHVGIFVSGSATRFTGFDQNWAGAYCRLISHGYECVIGWHRASAADPCAGVTCTGCEVCSGGACVDGCAPGDMCVDGLCIPPASPPPTTLERNTGLIVAGLLLGGLAGYGIWESRQHPAAGRGALARLEGDAGIGGARPSPARRPAARVRTPRRALAIPTGELGGGLERRRR